MNKHGEELGQKKWSAGWNKGATDYTKSCTQVFVSI